MAGEGSITYDRAQKRWVVSIYLDPQHLDLRPGKPPAVSPDKLGDDCAHRGQANRQVDVAHVRPIVLQVRTEEESPRHVVGEREFRGVHPLHPLQELGSYTRIRNTTIEREEG